MVFVVNLGCFNLSAASISLVYVKTNALIFPELLAIRKVVNFEVMFKNFNMVAIQRNDEYWFHIIYVKKLFRISRVVISQFRYLHFPS